MTFHDPHLEPDPEEAKRQLLLACTQEPETDIGNGRRLRRRFGDLAEKHLGAASHIAIHVANIGWHIYDGRRWKEDVDESLVRRLVHRAAEAIRKEAELIEATEEELAVISAGEVASEALESFLSGAKKKKLPTPDDQRFIKDQQEAIKAAEAIYGLIEDRRSARRRHAKSTAGSSKLTNMMAEAQPYVSRLVSDLNPDPLLVNCLSGTIAFNQVEDEESDPEDPRYVWKAELREHRQADMITKLIEVEWLPDVKHETPAFTTFLHQVQPDPEIRQFLKRFAGYLLTGLTVEQVMLFFYGAGRNGKSTYLDLLCFILGDYAVTLSIESFSGDNKRGGGEATPDLARLPGARLVSASEPEANVKLKDALIKTLTGGEKIPVRRLHKDFFEVDPHFKIILSGNHKPRVDDDSDGIWRRLLLVPWMIQIDKAKVDKALSSKLRKEAVGVFAWMVEGALEYLNCGLETPKQVTAASEEYRQESDGIGTFIRIACVVSGDTNDKEEPLDLYMAFEKFADREGVFKVTRSTFEKRFSKATERAFEGPDGQMRQFKRHRSNGRTYYQGIKLLPDWRPGTGDSSHHPHEEDERS
ncbi:MAG TPA: phage/plasmid primase, P4 family [Mesorhizobium sp.]|jgi:putative DNA primase/helicase|uniref:DNA primase family protein n=1 Tax=Mesorhizobium sp. TaxID=1871066 RepID=UPI002DDCEDFB|nr:phage/plasmid primase, P4 family [Mesorhizobium sp.]HEV2501463.1 phage/plasmid primase, P4 family [Mesorhizobium sp.]